jgi:hypothetical protein
MALTYDDLTSKTNKFIVPRMVDEVYKSSPLFTRLRSKNMERFEGGTSIRHPIMYAKLKGGPFTRGGSFDTSYVQTDTALEVNVKYYYVNVTLFGIDNVLNRGPEAAMSLVEAKMVNASGRMADLLGTDLFLDGQGTNSTSIALDGLQASVDDGSNFTSYGGITRTDISSSASSGINAYVVNSVGTLSLGAVQTAYGSSWFGREHVDLIVTTQPVWDIFWNKIQPQQRFREESSDVAKIGFQAMRYNGSSVTVDQLCPTGFMFGLNTKFIQFWITTMPKYQFGFTGWKEAQNTDDVAGQYLFGGNLLNVGPRYMFKLAGITG